jgi:hypothetical protein
MVAPGRTALAGLVEIDEIPSPAGQGAIAGDPEMRGFNGVLPAADHSEPRGRSLIHRF